MGRKNSTPAHARQVRQFINGNSDELRLVAESGELGWSPWEATRHMVRSATRRSERRRDRAKARLTIRQERWND